MNKVSWPAQDLEFHPLGLTFRSEEKEREKEGREKKGKKGARTGRRDSEEAWGLVEEEDDDEEVEGGERLR